MKKFLHILGIFGLIIGIPASIFGIYTYFYPDKAEPYYTIISDELAVTSPTSKIRLFYDSTEVPNIRIMQLALWNGGKNYIEKDDFINPYVVKISNSNVEVLQVDISSKSRKELDFKTTINQTKKSIYLKLNGKEVIESKDGLFLKIFYTSRIDSKWDIHTRIKGIPAGFKEYNLIPKTNKSSVPYKDVLFNYFALLLLMSSVKIRTLLRDFYSKNIINKSITILLFFFLIVLMSYLIYAVINESIYFPDFIE